MSVFLFLAWALGCLWGCGATAIQIERATEVAVVQTIDAGEAAFVTWAVPREAQIATEAVAACKAETVRAAYLDCTGKYVAPRRAPIDRVRAAIGIYHAALVAGGGNLVAAGADVVSALAAVGIKVGGSP